MRQGISWLQELHVLSQTESLMLEQLEYSGLDEIITSREKVIGEIKALECELADLKQEIGAAASIIPPSQRELLQGLEREAASLIARVAEVDRRNRLLLDQLRSQTLESWLVIQQQQRLHDAYQMTRTAGHSTGN
jgi:hypothetical protein